MTPVFTKYLIPTMECLARLYGGEPVWVSRLRACLAGKGYTEFTGVYKGLNLGIRLGLVREVPIGRKQSRYEPTPVGVIKGAVLDAVSTALGIVDDTLLDFMEPLTEYLLYSILLELPGLITASIINPRRRGLTMVCCDSYNRCFEESILPSRLDVYFDMIALKSLMGWPVRGLKPTDYGELYYYVKTRIMDSLKRGVFFRTPNAVVNPLVIKAIKEKARLRLSGNYNITQEELKH
jgi:hypothetical protein